jgi:uncharacterized protein (TIGR02001 family)
LCAQFFANTSCVLRTKTTKTKARHGARGEVKGVPAIHDHGVASVSEASAIVRLRHLGVLGWPAHASLRSALAGHDGLWGYRKALVTTLLLLLPTRAAAWTGVFVYADWTSDYRFYGMSSSAREPTEQGGIHWIAPDNFYAGVFASGVRFADFRHTNYETDVYAGRHFYFDNNDLNLELLYSLFPNQAGHAFYKPPPFVFPTYNFFESSAELSHKFGALTLSAKLIVSPSYGSNTGVMGGADVAVTYQFADWLSVDGRVGRQWIERGTDRTHWELGATATKRFGAKSIALDVRGYGTDLGRAECFGRNWCGPALVVKLTAGTAL